jgi:septum formation protein
MKIILASSSPYRQVLLKRLNLGFTTISPNIDESPNEGENGQGLACRLAEQKALAVGQNEPADTLIIGSDQVAECDGRLLGKPITEERAIEQLLSLCGKEVVFHTAMAINHLSRVTLSYVPTRIGLRQMSEAEIVRYVRQDKPLNCSGALKTEALGISLMTHFSSDDPTAIIGLPLISLCAYLRSAGMAVP